MTNAPYAGPSGSNVTPETPAAESARPRLYVPASWRAAAPQAAPEPPASVSVTDEATPDRMPSISAFLAEGPASMGAAERTDMTVLGRASALDASDDAPPAGAEDWPFADAAATTTELTVDLRAPDQATHASGESEAAPLPMWQDDDLLDIMPPPVRLTASEAPWSPLAASESGSQRAPYAGPTEGVGSGREGNESAARALESLARRVRTGELPLPSYGPELGDAAALAAALAALLGTRRG